MAKSASCEPIVDPKGRPSGGASVDLKGPKVGGSESFQSGPVPHEHFAAHKPWSPAGKPALGSPTSPNGRKRTEVKGS